MMNGKKVSKYNFLDRLKPFRSSRSGVFCKKDGFRNFAKFIGKYLCMRPATLVKKRLWHWRFPLNFAKFLKTPFFIEHIWWLLLTIPGVGFQSHFSNQCMSRINHYVCNPCKTHYICTAVKFKSCIKSWRCWP